jgi:hypothetical protein
VQDLTGAGCQTVPGAGPDLQCRTMVAVSTRSCALGPPGGRACADVQCNTACGNSASNCSCLLGTNAWRIMRMMQATQPNSSTPTRVCKSLTCHSIRCT